jgi:hypothetical protein
MFSTLMDSKGINKFFDYNLNKSWKTNNTNTLSINRFNYNNNSSPYLYEEYINNFNNSLPEKFKLINTIDFHSFLKLPSMLNVLSAENDSKQYSNSFKYILNTKLKKINNK